MPDSSVAASNPRSDIKVTKISRTSAAYNYQSSMTASERNGERRTVFSDAYLISFFDHARSQSGDSFPKGIVTNVCVTKGDLDFFWNGALGKYREIREIRAYTFEIGSSQHIWTHQLLDRMKISVKNYILTMFE